MIVCKFGGTSTLSLVSIKNIKKLKQRNNKRKIFVFSAIGKIIKNDKKITDLLIEITQNKNVNKNKKIIISKFNKLKKQLNQKINVQKIISKYIQIYFSTKDADLLISRGEYLTAYMMSKYLNIKFIPAEKIIYLYKDKLNYKKTKNKLNYYINKYKKFTTCGFYGIDENNKIKLFPRGGSDITGAIISRCLGAKIYENWTDVDGVRQVNPQIQPSKQIKKMSYQDLDIMTRCDVNVIHNDCIDILKENNIVLKVANIYHIHSKKTKIVDNYKPVRFICYKMENNNVQIFYKNKKYNLVCKKSTLKNYKIDIQRIYTNEY